MLFLDGSQSYSSTSDVSNRYTSGSINSVVSVASGGYGVKNPNLTKAFTDVASTQFYLGEEITPLGFTSLGEIKYGTSTELRWRINNVGQIELIIGGSLATIASSAVDTIRFGNTYYTEVDADIAASGHFTFKVNGVSVITYTGSTVNTVLGAEGTYHWDTYIRGGSAPSFTGAHLYIGDGSVLSGNLGQGLVLRDFLSADSTVQFTPSSGSVNYLNVNEASSNDGDSSYNSSTTVGDADLFTPVSVSTGDTILAFQVSVVARKTASGSATMSARTKQGATSYDATAGILTTSYVEVSRKAYAALPDGTTPILDSDFNALKFGYTKAS